MQRGWLGEGSGDGRTRQTRSLFGGEPAGRRCCPATGWSHPRACVPERLWAQGDILRGGSQKVCFSKAVTKPFEAGWRRWGNSGCLLTATGPKHCPRASRAARLRPSRGTSPPRPLWEVTTATTDAGKDLNFPNLGNSAEFRSCPHIPHLFCRA